MAKLSKMVLCLLLSAAVLSCTCATPLVVSEIQKTDKKLSCKDIILEINESEHYRELAKKEEGIGFGNMLMPVCWVTSYVDANQAIDAAEARVKYLGHIYDVLDCGGKSDKSEVAPAAAAAGAAAVAPFVAPPVIQIQPVPNQTPLPPAAEAAPKPKEDSAKDGSCSTPDGKGKYSHKHLDRLGKIYTHCHFNNGPHRHSADD